MRPTLLAQALRAGKHVYCEKPIATNLGEAIEIARLAKGSGLKHGAVQDKLFLPGLRKLDMLRRAGFFGRMLSVRIEFGYWVFEGDLQPIQRPSWNYRSEDGGGMILDMMCHWRYVLDNLFGEVQSISCIGATHIPQRWDEAGKPYQATADDAAYATLELKGHQGERVIAQVNSSWATRVRRDDLVTFHVDGTHGSAVAGLSDCRAQSRVNTPRPVWNPDEKQTMPFFEQWQEVPDTEVYDNGFKIQWEAFIRHVVEDAPYRWTLPEGAKGVQLVEDALQSWKSALGRRRTADHLSAPHCSRNRHEDHPAHRRRHRAGGLSSCAAPPISRRPRPARSSAASPTRPPMSWPMPAAAVDPWVGCAIDWDATIAYRRRLWSLGLGVAEAMDTAQRGMGLDWPTSLELIAPLDRCRARHARRLPRQRLRHRPAGAAGCRIGRRRDPRLRGADGGDRGARRQADRDGQPRAGPRRARPGRLRARLRPHAVAGAPAGDPALARRHVRSGAGRLLGQRRYRGGDATPRST